jgi:hypothetical protein
MDIKKSLTELITHSLALGYKHGVYTKEEFIQYMKEVKEMQNDSDELIRDIVSAYSEMKEE